MGTNVAKNAKTPANIAKMSLLRPPKQSITLKRGKASFSHPEILLDGLHHFEITLVAFLKILFYFVVVM